MATQRARRTGPRAEHSEKGRTDEERTEAGNKAAAEIRVLRVWLHTRPEQATAPEMAFRTTDLGPHSRLAGVRPRDGDRRREGGEA